MPLWVFFIQPNHQEMVRRLVSCVSTVVGLVCYCYSTSFIHLFGEWTWWKIFLYLLFSCLSCLAVLFRKEWSSVIIPQQHESFSRFLVATSTTILLFFSDRASKGEPDAFGVISCVAFSVMSLSCDFHELLTVFTGALLVQLMGIKLLLGAVGVVLCFIFIVPIPYLQRYLVIQGQLHPHHHELQSIRNEHHLIVDIDPLLQLPSNQHHHHHQTQVVSYLPSSIVEVIASLESSEDDEDQEEVMVVEEVASSLQTNNNDEDEPQELVDYSTWLILILQLNANIATDNLRYIYLIGVVVVVWLNHGFRFWICIRYLIHRDTIIHLIFVRYDIVSATMGSDDERIRKDLGRWLVSDVKKSLANILLLPVVAAYANLVNRFHKVLVRCSSDVLSRMERLTCKAQNALESRAIFSFMDQVPRMKIKGLKLD
ncbi:hypothetical protein PIB30_075849 [Stylosanthes scabra]|uniref:Uncharacterized protein n=1 Tax=Stylosanthes scabra TaxID=79078 RepID=A0ABU6TS97_9FABA|nr:hypothetical protein [Stylosanthes scabra]